MNEQNEGSSSLESGKTDIVVIGAANMDLVCRVARVPKQGETLLGQDLMTFPGGKAANQAVAAARLGARTHFIGCIGDDYYGQTLLQGLQKEGVGTEYIKIDSQASTGSALILVEDKGDNTVVVAPGANNRLSPEDIDNAEPLIQSAGIVLLQLEIPLETVQHAIELCRKHSVFTMLDPAPAPPRKMPQEMFQVDALTPNQSEAEALIRHDKDERDKIDEMTAKDFGLRLLEKGPKTVIMKLGAQGAMIIEEGKRTRHYKACEVKPVDTTAAGDAFAGALAVALVEGQKWSRAIKFANAAGAASSTALGAQPSLPTRELVEKMMG